MNAKQGHHFTTRYKTSWRGTTGADERNGRGPARGLFWSGTSTKVCVPAKQDGQVLIFTPYMVMMQSSIIRAANISRWVTCRLFPLQGRADGPRGHMMLQKPINHVKFNIVFYWFPRRHVPLSCRRSIYHNQGLECYSIKRIGRTSYFPSIIWQRK